VGGLDLKDLCAKCKNYIKCKGKYYQENCLFFEEKEKEKVVAIAIGDTHIGDEGFIYPLWLRTTKEIVRKIKEEQPTKIIILGLGDYVTGNDIYRNQQYNNLLGKMPWQVSAFVEIMIEFLEDIRFVSTAPIDIKMVSGHHDIGAGGNMAIAIQKEMRAWNKELNMKIKYKGAQMVADIGAGKKAFCFHGRGHSDYYPITYSPIRDVIKELTRTKADLILSGHTHWFSSVRFDWGAPNGIKWYIIGGYQTYKAENRQMRYGITERPVGTWMFIDGKEFEVEPNPQPEPEWIEFANFRYLDKILQRYLSRLKGLDYI
jgi:predicted phosphodiesterase